MILVDTSVWIDHLRVAEPDLENLLEHDAVAVHPMVIGELAVGSLKNRDAVVVLLTEQRRLPVVSHEEFLTFVAARGLMGKGLSYVDVHLLAAVSVMPGAQLWTRDRRLHDAAADLNLHWESRIA